MKKSPWLSGRRIYLLVFLFTVLVRLITISELSDVDPAFQYPIVDELTNVDQARGFLKNGPAHAAPYWKPPGYPALLALCALPLQEIGTTGHGVPLSYAWLVKILQAILDGATAILLAGIAGHCCGRRAALITGGLYSISWMPIYFCAQFLDTTFFTFLVVLSVSLAISAARENRLLPWALVGMTIGLAALTRATALPIAAALALAAWFSTTSVTNEAHLSPTKIQRAGRSISVLAGCLFTLLPVFAVNLKVGGEPILVSSNGGINFYIGNRSGSGIGSDGLTSVAAGPRWDDLLRKSSHIESAAERSRHYYKLTFDEISAAPGQWVSRLGRKAAALFSARDVPNNKNLSEEKERSRLLQVLAWLPGSSGSLIALILIGLLAGRRQLRQSDLPVLLTMVVLALMTWAFFVAGRYRVPILALGCIVASRGLVTWGLSLKSITLYLLLLVAIFQIPIPEKSLLEGYCIDPVAIGYMHEQKGQPQDAITWYQRSLQQDPDDVRALYNIGRIHQDSGDADQALLFFSKATQIAPQHSSSWNSLGVLLGTKDPPQALACFHKALKINPQYVGAWINLGSLLEGKNELPKALDAYQRARRLEPRRYIATILEARIQLKMNAPRKAGRLLQMVKIESLEPELKELLISVQREQEKSLETSPAPIDQINDPQLPDPSSDRPEANGIEG
ncbi:MAG: tetratricopeptide repeat protein [Planctomycetota bacterium]